jgi:CRP-like cAMP-binding protein
MTTDERYAALRGTRLATELSDEQCRRLADLIVLTDVTEGQVLVQEGTSDSHLYVVLKGVMGVVKSHGAADALTLNTLSAGDFAGELGFLDGMERYASLVALSDGRVIGITRERLESVLRSDPELVYRVMRAVVRVTHLIQRRLSMQQTELSNYIYKQHGKY